MASVQNQPKFVKLIMVTPDNNNKYYEMSHDGVSSNFQVKYGRVESTAVTGSYSIRDWDKKYREKVKKGYKDVTAFVSTEVTDTKVPETPLAKIAESKVEEFMSLMKRYTDNLVSTTYSVKATNVTQAQVDAAQAAINKLRKLKKKDSMYQSDANELLLELYTIIPRRMSETQHHLLPAIKLEDILQGEQDNLDAMASQVAMLKPKAKKTSTKKTKEVKTLLDVLGITMKPTKATKEIEYLVNQITSHKIESIFEVNKPHEDNYFNTWLASQKNKQTRILIHGTKCTSVIPILEIGLKIRPAGNFQFSGKVYGDGNYFSEVVNKSLGYTGYDKDKVLLVYEVHTGNPFIYDGWYRGNSFPLNYKELQSRGFDSTYVKAGGGLLNSEIIAYNEQQNRIKYIIWLKN